MKFERIPNEFLTESLKNWLIEEMGSFIPTVPQVYEFVRNQRGFEKHWEYYYRGGDFCLECRSDKDGKEGGYRNVFVWGYKIENGVEVPKGRLHIAKCDCIPAQSLTGPNYHELMEKIRSVHPDLEEMTVSYFNGDRIVDSKSQTRFVWEQRVQRGTVFKVDGGYEVNWDHSFWNTASGVRILEYNNVEVPEHIKQKAQYNTASYGAHRSKKRKSDNKRRISSDGYKGSIPKSIQGLI